MAGMEVKKKKAKQLSYPLKTFFTSQARVPLHHDLSPLMTLKKEKSSPMIQNGINQKYQKLLLK
jgi:hypothetical protein